MRKAAWLLMLFTFFACHERINPYDPGNSNFTTPPPIHQAYPVGGWYNQSGYLIGVRVQVLFIDAFVVSMSILNVLTSSTSVMARESVLIPSGRDSYTVDLIGDSVMPAGDYLVIFYWSDMSIGSCFFSVAQRDGGYVIQNVEEYDTLDIEH
jgi:hypothetical protein